MAKEIEKLPVGISDFKEIIEKNYYYVDKSLLIRDIIEIGSKTMIISRPRRFGKTLNIMMLKYFFENTQEDMSHLFKKLEIWKIDKYRLLQGKYPVIFLTFKDVKSSDFEKSYDHIIRLIAEEYKRHKYLLTGDVLDENDKKNFKKIVELEGKQVDYELGLKKLSEYLHIYHKEKVMVLIDEYDTPIHEGYTHGYYREVVGFVKNIFGSVLKDNVYLEKALLTGILRVAKESIFTGLNNFKVYSLLKDNFSSFFGLLEGEVVELLKYYGIEHENDDIRRWYNGYKFGNAIIYNPWSIINFAESFEDGLRPYWVNTSGNELIKKLIIDGSSDVKSDLEKLINGDSIKKTISDDVVFEDLDNEENAIWSFLLFTGYLKAVASEFVNEEALICELRIPNKEVLYFYKNTIVGWFDKSTSSRRMQAMLQALLEGEVEVFEYYFKEFVMNTMSYFDPTGEEPERVYQGFVMGMLLNLSDNYVVKSNRESGLGRYDLSIMPKNRKGKAYIFEFKKVEPARKETLEIALQNALAQIDKKKYDVEMINEGMRAQDIIKLGVAFSGKEVVIGELENGL